MTKVIQIIETLQQFLKEKTTLTEYRVGSQDFIRDSKLGFKNTIMLQLYRMKGSLGSELYNQLTMNNLEPVTDSAFSQSRYKIKSSLFVDMNKLLLNCIDRDKEQAATTPFGGYKIQAVDGSKFTLPNTKELQKHFGAQQGGSKQTPTLSAMCLFMCCYDVQKQYILKSEVQELKIGELSVAKSWVQHFDSQAITLFDRAYASLFFCYQMLLHHKPFIIRVKLSFNKVVRQFVDSNQMDSIVTFEAAANETFDGITMDKGTKIQVRLVKITLPSGETEVLMTSLFDQNVFSIEVLNTLYQMRWGIETAYDRLKNQLFIMCFSGLKPQAIYQDIYATVLIHNFQQLFINEAQIVVNQEVTNCKYSYNVNTSTAAGIFKFKIIPLLLTQNPQKIVQELIRIFSKNRLPVIKNKKSTPRKKSLAKRRNLITQTNFRRA